MSGPDTSLHVQPGAHPDPELVADLVEGLLPADSSAAVSLHLAGCPDCAGLRDDLLRVRDELRSLPPVGPMPADVATRLEAALAAAPAHAPAPTPAPASPGPSSATVHPLTSRLAGWRVPLTRALAAAAALAVLGLGGPAVWRTMSGGKQTTDSAASGGNAGDQSARAAGGSAASGPILLTRAGFAGEVAGLVGSAAARAPMVLAATPPSPKDTTSTPPASSPPRPAAEAAADPACVRLVAGDTTPTLVRPATLDGTPVVVVVVERPGGTYEAWAVPATCTGAALAHATVPK